MITIKILQYNRASMQIVYPATGLASEARADRETKLQLAKASSVGSEDVRIILWKNQFLT